MPEVIVTTRSGKEKCIDFLPGATLMQTLCDGGVDEMLALCGGVCSCATCHVFVAGGPIDSLPDMSSDENDLLEGSPHRAKTSRLSCQIRLESDMDGLRITVAPEDEI